jgi:prepilin-type N-terminal cleavage/methylation domain-containing protein
MKRKVPSPARPVPVDFGDEPWLPVTIRKSSVPLEERGDVTPADRSVEAPATIRIMQYGTRKLRQTSGDVTVDLTSYNACPPASPSPGGEARGEGGLLNRNSQFGNRKSIRGFTLVEILVVLVLLGLIVFALMAVFAGTQRAFRASLTQTDTLEGARAVMDLIAGDLQTMTPCNTGPNPYFIDTTNGAVNFYVMPKTFAALPGPPTLPSPLLQSLIGSTGNPPAQRTNVLENIFILSKGNINGVSSWIGTGYSVNTNLADGTMYPLYRYYMTVPASTGPAGQSMLFTNFAAFVYTNNANWSHLMDGVINLTARTYDTNGVWMTNGYLNPLVSHVKFVRFQPVNFTIEPSAVFYSNALPASVQIELGTIEDRVLSHAEGLSTAKQSNYLANATGQVHLFRQRVGIPNVDRTAYQ